MTKPILFHVENNFNSNNINLEFYVTDKTIEVCVNEDAKKTDFAVQNDPKLIENDKNLQKLFSMNSYESVLNREKKAIQKQEHLYVCKIDQISSFILDMFRKQYYNHVQFVPDSTDLIVLDTLIKHPYNVENCFVLNSDSRSLDRVKSLIQKFTDIYQANSSKTSSVD